MPPSDMPVSNRWLATVLETAINGALRLDPITRDRLAALEGRIIALQPEGYDVVLYLHPETAGVRVGTATDRPPDLSIHASPGALLQLLNGDEIRYTELGLHGDVQLARQLQALLAGLDPDWEEPLAQVFGDLPAHRLATLLRTGHAQMRRIGHSLLDASHDYLIHERGTLPSREQVERFLDAVDRLRDDYERLEARVRRLQQRLRDAG